MKKTTIVTILFLVMCQTVFSQGRSNSFTVFSGKEVKTSKKNIFNAIITENKSGVYVWRSSVNSFKQSKHKIEYYSPKLERIQSANLDLRFKDKKMDLEGFSVINGKVYVFSTFTNVERKKSYLFVQSFNEKTLSVRNDLKKIAEFDIDRRRDALTGYYNSRISKDENRFLIYYKLPYRRNENEKFGMHVFDSEFNEIWHKQVELPYSDELFKVRDYKLDDNGNVYIIGKLYQEKVKDERRGNVNYSYVIISYTENGNKVNKFPVSLPNLFLVDMQIAITPEFEIICAGFYSESSTRSAKGAYYLRLDPKTNTVKSQSYKDFDFNFITENLSERQKKKASKKEKKGENVEINNVYVDEIIMRDDGGAVIIGEMYYMYITSSTDTNGRTTYRYHYVYGDILLISINPDGTVAWTRKIPKHQHTTNDSGYFSSYANLVIGDKIFFVFNDNPKNLLQNDNNRVYSYVGIKRSVAVVVEVDINGNVSPKNVIFASKAEGYILTPKYSKIVNDTEMIFYALSRKKEKFVKVAFKK